MIDKRISPVYKNKMDFVDVNITKKDGKVLDVGCGVGLYNHIYQSRKLKFQGIDVDPDVVKYNKKARCADIEDLPAMVLRLRTQGLVGLEAYYASYGTGTVSRLVQLAKKHGLIATGGSDYHGPGLAAEVELGMVEVPREAGERLIARAQHRKQEARAK